MFARNIKNISATAHKELLKNTPALKAMREDILAGDVFVAKGIFKKETVIKIREYLSNVGRNSLPNYMPIEAGAPNSHRISIWDQRSYVKTCFHQFSFYPWNQDVFNLFELSKEVYHVKNLLSNNPADKFLKTQPEDGCTARLAFQFYPKSIGGMNKHQDPLDHHQLTVPTLTMSKKGVDFKTGGSFADRENGEKVYLDAISDIGDVVYFNPQVPHGVEVIDEAAQDDWLSFEGRWTMLFATNKVSGNKNVADAVDLSKK